MKFIVVMKMKLFSLLGLLLCFLQLSAQINIGNKHIVPVSPTSASLFKYENYPVNFSTGLPDIKIPIYEVKSGSITLPIYLSYHASGIRVWDNSGWIGNGWSLNAEPQLSRSVNHGADEDGYTKNKFLGKSDNYPYMFYYADNYAKSLYGPEEEPDNFYYRLLNTSGKFIYARQKDENLIYSSTGFMPIPFENIVIDRPSNKLFLLTDDKGFKYRFGTSLKNEDLTELTINYSPESYFTTGWKCTDIISPQLDSVRFSYQNTSTNYFKAPGETVSILDSLCGYGYGSFFPPYRDEVFGVVGSWNGCNGSPQDALIYLKRQPSIVVNQDGVGTRKTVLWDGTVEIDNSYLQPKTSGSSFSFMDIRERHLKEIYFTNGKVEFIESTTIGGHYCQNGPHLSEIKIYVQSLSGYNLIKSVTFYKSISRSVSYDAITTYVEKWKLDSMIIKDASLQKTEKYGFDYFGYGATPSITSKSIDYWGYYNGESNSTTVPQLNVSIKGLEASGSPERSLYAFSSNFETSTANRIPNEHNMKQGTLSKIIYPTGGYTLFDFEANKYKDNGILTVAGGLRINEISSYSCSICPPITKTYKYGENEEGAGLIKIKPDSEIFIKNNYYIEHDPELFVQCYIGSAGQYNLYEENGTNFALRSRTINSSSLVDIYFTNGAPVVYPKVTEYSGNQLGESLGKTVYEFDYSAIENRSYYSSSPGGQIIPEVYHDQWSYGQLKKKTDYNYANGNYSMVKVVENKYQNFFSADNNMPTGSGGNRMNDKFGKGAYMGRLFLNNLSFNPYSLFHSDFELYSLYSYGGGYFPQQIYTGTNKLMETKETLFSLVNGGSIETQKTYTYDAYFTPSSTAITNAKGEIVKSNFKYPYDFSTGVYPDMVSKNILSPIIEQTTTLTKPNNSTPLPLSLTKTNYDQFGVNNFYLPKSIEIQNGSNMSETRQLFNLYDAYGNIQEQQKPGDVKEVYLWGYKSQYPVAKIIGSDYNTVKTRIDQLVLDNATGGADDDALRTELNKLRSIPHTLVTCYTYAPLIGITSQTDPNGRTTYYEYDGFNRLNLVRDQNKKIISKYCYNYANQRVNCDGTITPVIFENAPQSKNFTRDDCPTGSTGTTLSYTVAAGTYTSTISIDDANAKARADVDANGQARANANGSCSSVTVYSNAIESQPFTKNDCTSGTGTTVSYTVAAGTYTSTISIDDANAKARADVDANGQARANANGSCSSATIYSNAIQSQPFTKNDCTSGTGTTVTYTVAAGTYTSTISIDDANAKARADVDANGQAHANANGSCSSATIYSNAIQSQPFTKNDCTSGTGTTVTYTVAAGTYTSTISIDDANAKARADVDANGQAHANANGSCSSATIYSNAIQSQPFTKNDCTSGTGTTVSYTVAAGTYTSTISIDDANAKARADVDANGQAHANTNGVCNSFFANAPQSGSFTKNDCPAGTTGTTISYTVAAGTYTSTISIDDANAKARADVDANGQARANANGVCNSFFANDPQSGTYTKNDCPAGTTGTTISYTVAAGTYTSTISTDDANANARADVDANGQAHANTDGSCSSVTVYSNAIQSQPFTKNDCTSGTGTTVTYTVAAGTYTSTISIEDANIKAQDDITANGQAYANANGTCAELITIRCNSSVNEPFSLELFNLAMNQWYYFTIFDYGEIGQIPAGTYFVRINPSSYSQPYGYVLNDTYNKSGELVTTFDSIPFANSNTSTIYIYPDGGASVPTMFSNTEHSEPFSKNDCPAGTTGSIVSYTVAAGSYTSPISINDANTKAQDDIAANGQAYANANGTCNSFFANEPQSGSFTKNDCPAGTTGIAISYAVAAGTYTSTISIEDANIKAQDDITANGQAYANANGTCNNFFENEPQSGSFTKNDCPAGSIGSVVSYAVAAGIYTSTISIDDANTKARTAIAANGQGYANANGSCIKTIGLYYSINNSNPLVSDGPIRIKLLNLSTWQSYSFTIYSNGTTYSNTFLWDVPPGIYDIEVIFLGSGSSLSAEVCGYFGSGVVASIHDISIDDKCNSINISN